LQKSGLLTAEEATSLLARAERTQRTFWDIILNEKKIPEEKISKALARTLHLPQLKLAAATIEAEALHLVSEETARKFVCLPISKESVEHSVDSKGAKRRPVLVLAMADPTDFLALQDVEFSSGCVVKPVVASRTEVLDAIKTYYEPEKWLEEFLQNIEQEVDFQILGPQLDEELTTQATEKGIKPGPAVRLVNLILQAAIKQGASDVHIEPTLNNLQVRTRVDGMLRELMQVPKWLRESLVSRLKILAVMDITERRVPQDGRMRGSYEGHEIDLRVSTLPTHYGEKVVLRILGSSRETLPTSALGLNRANLQFLKRAVDQPQGIILVTGPTGSGKTTTLYSLLNEKKNPSINIITVEDPIEIQLEGINQVQVNLKAGLTFASCLRSILRQDPDVILVGEIRDPETAEITFHAAMTGHLVFSTVHTNSTVATIGRLRDLGVEASLIQSSVNLILAQRLVRRICERCKEEVLPEKTLLEKLHLEAADFPFFHGAGCPRCGMTGYAGRVGVYEVLRMTPDVKARIGQRASEAELIKAAVAGGTIFLYDDALDKVRQGLTTVEEVLRVIQLQEEEVLRCPHCSSLINLDFAACPYCLFPLKAVCDSCRQELKLEWKICPYCGAQAGKTAATLTESPYQKAEVEGGEIPVPPPPPKPATTALLPAPRGESGKRPRILVVDDDVVVRTIVVQALEPLPFHPEMIQAANGPEGLEAAENLKPDLLILDLNMPGMNGFEVCGKLRANIQTAFIPILMLSANTDEQSRSQGFLVGTDDYMGKPVSIPELHTRVTRLLRRTYGL
jgi:type IV pilus assembly protein PilB